MKLRSNNFETGLWIVGGAVAVYLLIFAAIWFDEAVSKTRYSSRLPVEVQEVLRIVYFPIIYPLYRLGLIP